MRCSCKRCDVCNQVEPCQCKTCPCCGGKQAVFEIKGETPEWLRGGIKGSTPDYLRPSVKGTTYE